jgi:DnaJ-domain-containing protein 1
MYSQVFGIDIFENLVRFYLNKSDAAFADYVYRYAKKAFSYSISLESGRGMLVYPRQNDSAKRRFFVDCLVANYNKTHQNHKVSINDAEKPLWVEFVDNPTLPTSAFVHVRFYADRVHFRVYNPNDDVSLAMSELTRRNLKLKPAQQVRLKITDANSLARLEFWIQSCLDNKIMKIIYNKEELVNMKAHFRQKSSWQTPVNNAFILKEHYQILDAKTNESFIAIQKRYRNLVKQYHPDNVYGKDEATVKSYTEKFRQVQCAFDAIRAYYEKAS